MRILDSKNPAKREVIDGAPVLTDFLDAESAGHFAQLRQILDAAGIGYRLNPRLVRGLDYYTRTVFEWVTDRLGAQGTVCAGGRYDGLVEQLGGRPTPAIGWALGLERLLELYRVCGGAEPAMAPDLYLVASGQGTLAPAFRLAEQLRDQRPALSLEMNLGEASFKAQLRRADRSGARVALILGEAEVAGQAVGVKPLREDAEQRTVAWAELAAILDGLLGAAPGEH
jgi:histidyl-tRNA synthetase